MSVDNCGKHRARLASRSATCERIPRDLRDSSLRRSRRRAEKGVLLHEAGRGVFSDATSYPLPGSMVLEPTSERSSRRVWRHPAQDIRRRVVVLSVARPPAQTAQIRNPRLVAPCNLTEGRPPANRAQGLLERLSEQEVALGTLGVHFTATSELDMSKMGLNLLVGAFMPPF